MRAWRRFWQCWSDLLTGGKCFTGEPNKRRMRLLNLMLLVGSGLILFFALLDLFVTDRHLDAAAELAGGAGFLATFFYLRITGKFETAALAAALITIIMILGNTMVAGIRDLAFFWIALFPLVAFFLLGAVRGLVLSAAFSVVALAVLGYGMNDSIPVMLNWVALLNVACTLLGIVVFVYYYEASRAQAERELEEAAKTDFLTGLFNRRHLMGQFELEQQRALRHGLPLSLLLIDIDSLKLVNDHHGHEAGDAVIQAVARRLLEFLRRNDLVARLGGEEFGVVLPHTGAEQAAQVAEKLRTAVEETATRSSDGWISVTISIGVAENGIGRDSFASLFAAADGALHRAKMEGRNRVAAS